MSEFGYLLACAGGMLLAALGGIAAYRAVQHRVWWLLALALPPAAFGLWVLRWATPGYLFGGA